MKEGKKWYQSFSNWLIIVGCVILIPILVINLWIMFQSKTNSEKVPSVFGYKPFMVLSGSMESNIHKGDLIITKETNPASLKIDDIIAFKDAAGTITTHRIIDIIEDSGETYFITKGDNNSTQDQNLVALEDVEGIYVGRIPGIGSMMDSLAKPTTIMILVVSITAIFIIGFMISNKRQQDAERREFMEYKLRKELEEKERLENTQTKKTKSIKAEENKEAPKKKTTSTKTSASKSKTASTKSTAVKNTKTTKKS
ncbi:MAG: signal peptidase I [Bacilli bacterium]|nr:signal peptidase I [Bacilli bacterium]